MFTEFLGNLACPLDFGHSLVIVAKTIDGAKRFHINIRTDKEQYADIGLHLSVRFTEDIIIRNSQIDTDWGKEERDLNRDSNTIPNPITSGDFFLIHIFVGETKFYISINNRPYCTYEFRMPVNQLKSIEIRNQIQAIKQVDHRTAWPYAWPPIQSIDPLKAFTNDVPIVFSPGHVMIITARPFGSPKGSFIFKFYEAESRRELLHFNVRFEAKVVVRNSMKNNMDWMPEERDGGFPFVYDQQFTLALAFTEKEFWFAVDGARFINFGYKIPNILQKLTGLKVATTNGMDIHVTAIDHIQMPDSNCDGFEKYSDI